LQQISELASKSKSNVITLDDATYAYYAITKPNPYNLIVFLTAAHPKFRCGVCKQLDREFQLLASSYATQVQARKEEPNVFFIRLDYEASQRVFQSYQVTAVPIIFHLPVRLTDKSSSNDYQISTRDKYQAPADPDAESLAGFLQEKTGVVVEIKRSMLMAYVIIIVVFGVMLLLVQPVVNALPFILRILRFKYLWLTVSTGFYTISISGMIFDIIRSPQM
jgi:oligosaccharyltransferase complex subunit gamma